MNVTEVLVSDFKNVFPGISNFAVGILVLRTDRAQCKILFLELRALAELLGPYGIRFIQEALSIQIGYQIQEILTTVKKNRNTLR